MSGWLNGNLKKKVRKVFEPRYKRRLTDDEVVEIAENLTAGMEIYLRMKWKEKCKYESKLQS